MNNNKGVWKKWAYWFSFAIAVIIVYKTLDNFKEIKVWISNLFNIIMPFIIGIIIAYLLYLPSRKLENLYKKVKFINKKARLLSVITVYIIAIIIIMLAIRFIVPVISQSIIDLVNNFQSYYSLAMENINSLPSDSIFKSEYVMSIADEIKNIDLKEFVNIERLSAYAKGAINIANGIFDFFVAIIVSVYILLERTEIVKFIKKLTRAMFNKNTYDNINKYFDRTNEIFLKFLASQLLDAIVVGILTSIAMSIMGVKYAVLLGFLIGISNMIPYFGAIIGVIISIIITLLTGGVSQAIWMAISVIVLQQIDANIINPKIVGDSLKISPLLVIFAVTIGGAYFGILGMFLAVPVIAVIKIVLLDFINLKNRLIYDEIEVKGK
ncbi:MAG: AI-2E family transporter [Clostridia bacterium]|nr:AI-2E family transporter [Clostridia bacterium]